MIPGSCLFVMRALLPGLAFLAACAGILRADVELNNLFGSDMVLQRDMPVPIWGTAGEGERVAVILPGQRAVTTASGGVWRVTLRPLSVGDPFAMVIAGDENTIFLTNVVAGEVWLCSGQSNMERQLGPRPPQKPLQDWEREAASADVPLLRHFAVAPARMDQPAAEVRGRWEVCTPATVTNWTAVGYYFGRNLQRALQVPVGLIHASLGGTMVEAWTRTNALLRLPDAQDLVLRFDEVCAAAKRENRKPPQKAGQLYNAMIAPLQPCAIRGVIWYQGESNSGNARQYRDRLPLMIADWREQWGIGDFPFLFAQIAPHQGMNPELREAQLLTWQRTTNTAMVVLTDCGDASDIHPTNKAPVGARLALAARALAYGEKIEYSGPVFESMHVENNCAVLSFSHLGGGLSVSGAVLRGFTLAGAGGSFVPARAEIRDDGVIVWADQVARPVAVRYGWANVPDGNLFNREGLPASPFRSDVD